MRVNDNRQIARRVDNVETTAGGLPGRTNVATMPVRLTPSQLKVMRGVHSGLPNKQIAYDLGIAEATVKAHMTAVMRKLNVHNRTQVAIAAHALALHAS